jgi:hypothetical protein
VANDQELGDSSVVRVYLIFTLCRIFCEDGLVELGELLVFPSLFNKAGLALDFINLFRLEVRLVLEALYISDLLCNVPYFFEGGPNERIILLFLLSDDDVLVDFLD